MCWGDHIYGYNTAIRIIYISAIIGKINDLNALINICEMSVWERIHLWWNLIPCIYIYTR